MTLDRMSARAGKGHGTALVGGQPACEADLLFVIVDGRSRLMRLATWNVNSLTARLPRVTEWIERERARRALPAGDQAGRRQVPRRAFSALGYESAHHGDGRWNGVAVAQPGRAGRRGPRIRDAARTTTGCRIVAATCGGIRVHSVYVPNGRSLDSEHYGFKLEWLARLRALLDETCRPGDSVAVCGDFNVAPDDGDVWDPAAFRRR